MKTTPAALLAASVLSLSRLAFAANPPLPVIPAGTFFIITTPSATGNDTTEDTTSIQAAINAATAAGGGTVLLPAGTYQSGPLTSPKTSTSTSPSRQRHPPDAPHGHLRLRVFRQHQLHHHPKRHQHRNHRQRHRHRRPGLRPGGPPSTATPASAARRAFVEISGSSTVAFTGITLQNAPEFNLAFGSTNNVTIDGIKINNPSTAPNTDGVDPAGNNYLIQNRNISPPAMMTSPSKPGSTACSNITITQDTFASVGHGVSVGGQTNLRPQQRHRLQLHLHRNQQRHPPQGWPRLRRPCPEPHLQQPHHDRRLPPHRHHQLLPQRRHRLATRQPRHRPRPTRQRPHTHLEEHHPHQHLRRPHRPPSRPKSASSTASPKKSSTASPSTTST